MDFHVIIPARFGSTRLPKKVLADINGKPMIQHVYERALESGASQVLIATDHDEVVQAAEQFDAPVCMTSGSHQTGTERLVEAVSALECESNDIVIGLQADEPFIPPAIIQQLAENLIEHDHAKTATMATKLTDAAELFDPAIVKVILNHRGFAQYFSRAPIPWSRDQFDGLEGGALKQVELASCYYRHIGIYGYRAGFLASYEELNSSPYEKLESLEQLRVLWNGYRMHVGITDISVPAGVDTPEDLDRVRRLV